MEILLFKRSRTVFSPPLVYLPSIRLTSGEKLRAKIMFTPKTQKRNLAVLHLSLLQATQSLHSFYTYDMTYIGITVLSPHAATVCDMLEIYYRYNFLRIISSNITLTFTSSFLNGAPINFVQGPGILHEQIKPG